MDFSILVELTQSITRNKIKQIEVLGNPESKGTLIESFYEAIYKGIVTSDESAVKYLYGHSNKNDAAYLRLKNRLIRQLINTSLFTDINQPSFNDRSKAYHNCYRDFAACFMLMLKGANSYSTYLFEQILQQSIKYEFIDLATEVSRHLRVQTSRDSSNWKKHQSYVTIHRRFEEKRRLEMLAFDYYEELVDYYIIRCSPNEEIKNLADKYFNELLPLSAIADTSRFYFHTYSIGIINYFAMNDYVKVLELADQGITILKERKNTNRSMIQIMLIQKLICLSQLRVFENNIGEETFENCLSIGVEGDFNWFRAFESYFYFLSYKHDYIQALSIYEKASSHPKFSTLNGIFAENWLLIGGYLHILAALNKIDKNDVQRIVGPYRFGRLVNEINFLDKDRKGKNIPLMLLPILFDFANGNFYKHTRSKESIEKYRQRYLDNEINQRSAIFVNMLLALDKKAYNPIDAEKKIKKGLEMLSQQQPQVIGQYFAIEIIPYEDLWAMLMEKIDKKGKEWW